MRMTRNYLLQYYFHRTVMVPGKHDATRMLSMRSSSIWTQQNYWCSAAYNLHRDAHEYEINNSQTSSTECRNVLPPDAFLLRTRTRTWERWCHIFLLLCFSVTTGVHSQRTERLQKKDHHQMEKIYNACTSDSWITVQKQSIYPSLTKYFDT